MATYNGERYIREQLNSLAAQTLLPNELVVTDDGSLDRTVELVEAFGKSAPFSVRVFQNSRRLGYGDNFLLAVSLCECDLIAFCDQDDVWLPNKLASVVAPFDDEDVVMTSHNAILIDENGIDIPGRILKYHRRFETKIEKRYWSIYLGFTLTIRNHSALRTALRPFQDFGFQHDEFIYFLYSIWGKVGAIDRSLVKYRRHGKNVSGSMESEEKLGKSDALCFAYRQLRRRYIMALKLRWPSPDASKKKLRPVLRTAKQLRMRMRVYNNSLFLGERTLLILQNLLAGIYADSKDSGLGFRALIADVVWMIRVRLNKSRRDLHLRKHTC